MPEVDPKVVSSNRVQSSRGSKKFSKPAAPFLNKDDNSFTMEAEDEHHDSYTLIQAKDIPMERKQEKKKNNQQSDSKDSSNRDRMSVSKRLGLHFPVSRIGRYLRKGRFARRVGGSAPIFFAAVLDYMVSELVVVAAEKAKALGRTTIKPRHIQLAIREDAEFLDLLGDVTISQGGVMPMIQPELIAPKNNILQMKKNKQIEDHDLEMNNRGTSKKQKKEIPQRPDDQESEEDDEDDQSEYEEQDEEEEHEEESQEYGSG